MFLNTPTVKKFFKRAFNSTGLVVARPNEDLIYIAGSRWRIEMDYSLMPLKQKAQLIELIGDIPEVGKELSATKDGKQMNPAFDSLLADYYMDAKVMVYQVPIAIERPYFDYQLFQEQNTKEFLAVDRELMSLIDNREIDFENEGMPCGPCIAPYGNHLYWHNAAGTLCIELEKMDKEALKVVEMLQGIEIRRES